MSRKVKNILDDLLKESKGLKEDPKPRFLISTDLYLRMCVEQKKKVNEYRGYKVHTDERLPAERIYLIKADTDGTT